MTVGSLKIKSKTNKKGNTKKTIEFFFTSDQGQFRSLQFDTIPEDEVASALQETIRATASGTLSVEFEEEGGRILKLREAGQPWKDAIVTEVPTRTQPIEQLKTVDPKYFHNPYNFVPVLPRDRITGELSDRKPVGHGRYLPNCWTGRIAVKLTTITPLLIPDAAVMTEVEAGPQKGHKTFPIRIGVDGKPYLPPTSIKGMLRTAYEAITNSRLAVIESHNARLAYRMPAQMGLQLVPAHIMNDRITLYPGTSEISHDGKPNKEMYAAWLPRYDRGSLELRFEVRYPDGSLPKHGDHVRFWAEKYAKYNRDGRVIFTYWKVRQIVRFNDELGDKPGSSSGFRSHKPIDKTIKRFEGYVYITNKNIDNKHDERIFICDSGSLTLPLSNTLKEKWQELIADYQLTHQDDIKKGRKSPPALDHSEWSRHVVAGTEEQNLKEGMLCYAHVKKEKGKYRIQGLYPVMITRGLYEIAPIELLDNSLNPATQKDKLSPADRVFGWVNQKGKGSYKGHLRIHSVTCLRSDAVDDFGSKSATVPLTILGQPKPQQARFYCADDESGKPIEDGDDKEEGYKYDDQGLRGRKVYPHHNGLPQNYWQNPTEDRTQEIDNGHYQEYRRPKQNGADQLDDQNRSIKGWVKPETSFEFDIDINNLSGIELGALLWLLASPDIHYHRIGGGKPLGFGSVWLDIDWGKTDLRLGADWSQFYRSLTSETSNSANAVGCIDEYQKAVVAAYGQGKTFDQVSFIAAFCRCSKGYEDNAAIHYPRSTSEPTPEGEAFNRHSAG